MDLTRYADLFLTESREHLRTCNTLLLEWEQSPKAPAPVDGLFRALHTLKGMAATMGYGLVSELAHHAETLLDGVRAKRVRVSPKIIQVLFKTVDRLEEAIGAAVGGDASSVAVADLVEELERVSGTAPADRRRSTVMLSRAATSEGVLRIEVTIGAHAPLKGARAALVLRRAAELGVVAGVDPAPEMLQDERFGGTFSLRLVSDRSPAEITAALQALGDIESLVVTRDEGEQAPAGGPAGAERDRTVRVELSRLDRLMNAVGELAIGRSRLLDIGHRLGDPDLLETLELEARLVRDMQRDVLEARMTPVGEVFDRFPRLVRDVARSLGREVTLRLDGRDIELDRSIVEQLSEPLVHLIRNAIDHGIESPETRVKAGKGRAGRLVVSATREANSVSIRVSDDGRGIDRAAVMQRAQAMNLVDQGTASISDDQVFKLLMQPGFSTVDAVSEVSGRGVGIDVVNTQMRSLGGAVEMITEPGRGTTFTLRVPVTLSITRALVAGVGAERYALPLTHVSETVDFDPKRASTVNGRDVLMVGDHVVPLVFLSRLVGASSDGNGRIVRPSVILLEFGDRRSGIVVDQMLGQFDIVVKPFSAPRGTLPVFSGATILPDGRPALILDAGGLM